MDTSQIHFHRAMTGTPTFFSLHLHLQHMEVPRLGVKLKLQLRPTPQLQQCQILNPLSKARDQTFILTETMSGSYLTEPQRKVLDFIEADRLGG